MKSDVSVRYILVGALLTALPIVILLRLIQLQTNPDQVNALANQRARFEGYWRKVTPARGQIFDRWGHLMAGNMLAYEVGVDLKDVENPDTIAKAMNMVVGSDYALMLSRASEKPSEDLMYLPLERNVSPEKVAALRDYIKQIEITYATQGGENPPSLAGLAFSPHLARTYPETVIASNLIGFVNLDGLGVFGVEEKYNHLLAGKEQWIFMPNNPNRVDEMSEIPDGISLVLTIDREVQAAMERLIDQAIRDNGAASGTIIVMDPRNGEVLAMATTPRLDLNQYESYANYFPEGVPFNRGVSQTYEPGSVFKVLTMAAALDSGAVKPETSFLDTGMIEVGGIQIFNWNQGGWGPVNMTQCMQHSLNVCLAWTAVQMGPHTFYKYMQSFGIGRLSGIDLADEAVGMLTIPGDGDWYEANLGTNSFGQGVSMSPLTLASAVSAIANDGKIMAPHIVRSTIKNGAQHDMDIAMVSSPIKPETARTLTEMLAQSLEIESSDALVPGYRMAGKTGTAEIPTPSGYTSNLTNASFVGWGPVDDPQLLVYIWLEEPTTSVWASEVAAPIFSQAVQELVVLLKIPPDDVRKQLYGQ